MSNLEQHYIAKIEGHGSLNIGFRQCKAELKIEEGERLFEALLLGRPYHDAPFITSRICGVCPVAHTIASIKALENALNITPDETTIKLRKIILAAQIIQSHGLHLFFLAMPDYIGYDSTLTLSQKDPQKFALALALKKFGDTVTEIVGGRSVHPISLIVGGFSKLPTKNSLAKIKKMAKINLDNARATIKLFASFKYPSLKRETEYLALVNHDQYEIYHGSVESSYRAIFHPDNYKLEIEEVIKSYSTAKFGRRNKHGFMVGAIARLSLHQEYLNPLAKKALKDSGFEFPTYNPFHNNFAQAVEILHFTEEIIKLTDELLKAKSYLPATPERSDGGRGQLKAKSYQLKAGKGVGAVEAPRGTLYHYYELDKNCKIKNCDIITPTAQNLTNIEEDAETLLKENQLDQLPKNVCIRELEMLIRAYDPCITCSVH